MKMFCGECGQMVNESDMWSDFTCKKCADNLGLVALCDENFYGC